jgi:tetratricopeptide (TPR) repeat protein
MRLRKTFPASAAYAVEFGGTLHHLAFYHRARKEWDQARALLEQAIALQQGVLQADPTHQMARRFLANHYVHLGLTFRGLRAFPVAEAVMRQAVTIREKLAHDFPNVAFYRTQVASAYEDLVRCGLVGPDRLEEAEQYCQKTLQVYEELRRQFPNANTSHRLAQVSVLNLLGDRLADGKQWEEAEQAYRQGQAIIQELGSAALGVAEYESWLGTATHALATVRYDRGDQAEAFRLIDAAIQHQEAALRAQPGHAPYVRQLQDSLYTLASFWIALPDRRTLDAELSGPFHK